MPNLSYEAGIVTNLRHYAKLDDDDDDDETGEGCVACEKVASGDRGLMANLFGSEGRPADVLKIVAKTRTGGMNFTETIQKALKAEYGEQTVSVGGVFVIRKGKARLHVMPDSNKTPLKTREEVDAWLRYFNMSAPLVCLSVFHSHDPGLDPRMEHTHCFSDHNEGGHYHDDTTPEEAEYEAYFNVASVIYRIDRPGVQRKSIDGF
jgi:Domain of Unknown Function (DUF1907)